MISEKERRLSVINRDVPTRVNLMNPDFWADNQDEINEKWEAMKAGL